MRILISLFVFIISFSVYSQTKSIILTPSEPVGPKCKECRHSGKSEEYREDSFGSLLAGYQFANTWVIGKKTASYTQILNSNWSLEVEYATSKRDMKIVGYEIGNMREDRITFFTKYYIGNSFHVSFGPYMSKLTINTDGILEDQFGNRFDNTWKLESYGAAVAFGSRWQNSWGLTWGVDWARINFPLKIGQVSRRKANLSEADQQNVDKTFRILRTLPTFTFVGINIGYTF